MMDYLSPSQLSKPSNSMYGIRRENSSKPPRSNSNSNYALPKLETLSPSNGGYNNTERKESNSNIITNVPSSSSAKGEILGSIFDPQLVSPYLMWQRPYSIGPGFFNEGNTCYLNSTLQCLLYLPPFTQLLLQETKEVFRSCLKSSSGSGGNITMSMGNSKSILELYYSLVQEVYQCIQSGGNNNKRGGYAISPKPMVQSLRRLGKQFQIGTQEDAHEYLRQLLDTIHEEILKVYKLKRSDGKITETTLINRLFGGTLCNTVTCIACGYFSQTFNHFEDISLDIKSSSIHSIEQALGYFTQIEYLSSGNEWKCDGCKQKVKASKQMTICEVPTILVLQLKRFSPYENMFAKITKHIQFAMELSFTYNYILPCKEGITGKRNNTNNTNSNTNTNTGTLATVTYELTGIIVHHGYSLNAGHYIAYVKAGTGQWYEMNDQQITPVTIQTVQNAHAYILFYTRITPLSLPISSLPTSPTTTTNSTTTSTSPLRSHNNSRDRENNRYSSSSNSNGSNGSSGGDSLDQLHSHSHRHSHNSNNNNVSTNDINSSNVNSNASSKKKIIGVDTTRQQQQHSLSDIYNNNNNNNNNNTFYHTNPMNTTNNTNNSSNSSNNNTNGNSNSTGQSYLSLQGLFSTMSHTMSHTMDATINLLSRRPSFPSLHTTTTYTNTTNTTNTTPRTTLATVPMSNISNTNSNSTKPRRRSSSSLLAATTSNTNSNTNSNGINGNGMGSRKKSMSKQTIIPITTTTTTTTNNTNNNNNNNNNSRIRSSNSNNNNLRAY